MGNANVPMEPQTTHSAMPDVTDDAIIPVTKADLDDDLMLMNKTANHTIPTELPVFWEYKLSLMVQAYAGRQLYISMAFICPIVQ